MSRRPGDVLADLDLFRARCAEAEYTDTGEAWSMIDALEEVLIAELEASTSPGAEVKS